MRRSESAHLPGYGIIEALIGVALFTLIAVSMYQAFTGLTTALSATRAKLVAADLVREQVELLRNLPYASVGTQGGIPSGSLLASQTLTRGGLTFSVTTTVQNVDDSFDGLIGGADTSAVADYRRVTFLVSCTSCRFPTSTTFSTLQAPLALESSNSVNGALFIRVLNTSGDAVDGATVTVLNTDPNPDISLTGTTDAQGWYKLIDVPPGTNAYQITVTKSGYSTDRTYTPGASGLNTPSKAHATVTTGSVTQQSFAIDQLGSISISSLDLTCVAKASVPFRLRGSKTLGTNSGTTVYKYDQTLTTDASGLLSLADMEPDGYVVEPTSTSNGILGTEPLNPVTLLPAASQSMQLYSGSAPSRTLVVSVKDGATGLPVTGASVTINKSSFTPQTLVTGEGFLSQTDWSDGSGQANFSDPQEYWSKNSYMDDDNPDGDLTLVRTQNNPVRYTTNLAELISSTFDNGGAGNFHEIFYEPTNQPSQTGSNSVRLQIATNNDGTTWNFKGPDGTGSTYYTSTNTTIHPSHDGDRYLRYKVFLQTSNNRYTPNVSDVFFTFTQSCAPPGQVAFTGLGSGTYSVTVSKSGYGTSNTNATLSSGSSWMQHSVTLNP